MGFIRTFVFLHGEGGIPNYTKLQGRYQTTADSLTHLRLSFPKREGTLL